AAMNFNATVQVILPSGTTDGTVGPGGGTVVDNPTAPSPNGPSITLPPGAAPTDTAVSIDVITTPLNFPTPAGYTGTVSPYVDFGLDPHPTGLLGPPGYSATLPLTSPLPPNTPLTLYRIDPVTSNLVPSPSVAPGFVNGTVNPNGTSVTFNGIASFSTVVALMPNGAIPGDVNGDFTVNCADLAIVKASFGKRTGQLGFDLRADINRD